MTLWRHEVVKKAILRAFNNNTFPWLILKPVLDFSRSFFKNVDFGKNIFSAFCRPKNVSPIVVGLQEIMKSMYRGNAVIPYQSSKLQIWSFYSCASSNVVANYSILETNSMQHFSSLHHLVTCLLKDECTTTQILYCNTNKIWAFLHSWAAGPRMAVSTPPAQPLECLLKLFCISLHVVELSTSNFWHMSLKIFILNFATKFYHFETLSSVSR